MQKRTIIFVIAILISALLSTGCTQSQPGQQTPQPTSAQPTSIQKTDTIQIAATQLGNILVDKNGMALYYFARDTPANGTSSCNSGCAAIWPAFNVSTISVSPPLSLTDFSTLTRDDGTQQVAFWGWPLYYYQNDKKPGDVNGEGFLKIWYVVKPDYSVMVEQKDPLGSYITDDSGMTLYYFLNDTPGTSTCTGPCSATWTPFSADPLVPPSLLKSSDFSTISRADGMNQTAFMGRPLYTYTNDMQPGDATGQGYANLWYVANVSGVVPTVAPPATTATMATMATTVTMVTPTNTPTTVSPYGGGSSGGY
jgi:predicted lipoprotein with Yx(FWY)xxD motif